MNFHQPSIVSYLYARAPGIGSARLSRIAQALDLDALSKPKRERLKELRLPEEAIDFILAPPINDLEKELRWAEQPHRAILLFTQFENQLSQHLNDNLNDAAPLADRPFTASPERVTSSKYPRRLKETAGAPVLLYAYGNLDLLDQPQIAIVGSRNPSRYGLDLATQFGAELAKFGFVITSGLASGIDGASHRGALEQNNSCIAVLGSGLESIYPAQHQKLADTIVERGGLLLSEHPPWAAARAEYFPRRNRVISGLSLGVLVIEAALKSGSLITARYAVEQGREVFALPGSIHNPLSKGTHALIREGAKLVETTEHILEELAPQCLLKSQNPASPQPSHAISKTASLNSEQQKVWDAIDFAVTAIDQIIGRSQLSAEKVLTILVDLELNGIVIEVPGGYSRANMSLV